MKTIQVSFPPLDVLNNLGQEFCFTLFFLFFSFGLDLRGYWGFLDWFCEAIVQLMLRLRDTFERGRWQNHQYFLVALFSSHFSLQFSSTITVTIFTPPAIFAWKYPNAYGRVCSLVTWNCICFHDGAFLFPSYKEVVLYPLAKLFHSLSI